MSEPANMDEAAKQRVKDALTSQARSGIQASQTTVDDEHRAAELDQDASFSVDDQSQADEAGDLAGLFERSEAHEQAVLARIEGLDFGPKSQVEPGAIIAFGGDHFVVGVVAEEFECDGVTYEGISDDAPIYEAIEGLKAGDTFTFNGTEQRIDSIA